MKWDPTKYSQFGNFRDRPFFDLTARVTEASPRQVVDLGCGPGNLTATLAERWPDADVLGLDSSTSMLERAAVATAGLPGLRFAEADIAQWMPGEATDIVVSNAALQWVPHHRQLLPRWLAGLKPGAWIAFQVPGNFSAPSHALMRELADSPRWAERLAGVLRHDDAVAEPGEYLEMMLDAGYTADAWETTYQQVLHGDQAVLEWVRGTALVPVMAALKGTEAAEFEADYAQLLLAAYPQGRHGTVFPFRRIFAVGQKGPKADT